MDTDKRPAVASGEKKIHLACTVPFTDEVMVVPPRSNWCFSFAPELVDYSAPRDLHRRAAYSICES